MTEQAKPPTAAELAEIKAAADRMSGYWPATATILLAEVERLQGEVRRLREENTLLKQHKDCLMSWGDQEWEALDGAARAHWLRIADWYAKQRAALGSKEGDG